jgi:hypothetical protein
MFLSGKYKKDLHDLYTIAITIDYNNSTSMNNINNIINTYGVCIIKNVLNELECNKIIQGMCSDFSHITQKLKPQFDINNPVTWSTLDNLFPIDGMLYQHWGLGQSQVVWDIRTNDKVIDVFRRIYSTSDLLVSYDGIAFGVPPEKQFNNGTLLSERQYKNKFYNDDKWHFDQSLTRPNFECIQGWINAFDTSLEDSTTAIMIYSNKYHNIYANHLKTQNISLDSSDWIRVENTECFVKCGCIPYRVEASKGSLVLWDSRTLHYGSKPILGRAFPTYRMLIYLCYTPALLITEAKRKRKVEIFYQKGKKDQGRMTNHWPHKPKMFPEIPHIRSSDVLIPDIVALPYPIVDLKYRYLIGER